ncbi:universal stress protein [Pyrinomonas methylaliphatogenes]|uniref:Universal stress protein UspA-like protein n=1 Tax=Pyrinomonas methylaliphatogenes TaxID=454194 RepID=A0A0B6X189_9BACT|nr:universal stress protein [Pyrinomonas methylaliphatogenes]CDM66762.1 universal stress protein UspA-like protein [Pyrinomonas methylaliphatogenes]
MYPFRNILFPTDFSPHAHAALKYAAAFARESGGRLVVLSVQEGSVPANLLSLPDRALEEEGKEWLRTLRRNVRNTLADPLLSGLEVETVIVEGEPAAEIARAARDFHIDLITVATHGRKGLARFLFGSTAEEIIAEAPCPVLSVRPPQHDFVEHRDGRTEIHLNRILLATDFRPVTEAAARLASEIARRAGAELHAIYVISDFVDQMADLLPDSGNQTLRNLRAYAQERMSRLARELGGAVSTHIAEGRPYEEIVRLAMDGDFDLIVAGTSVHPSLFGGAASLGQEIERIVRNAPCPVLCVPAGQVMTSAPARIGDPLPQT